MEEFLRAAPLAWFFIVALCLPWCRYLEAVPGISPQLYGDYLKCISSISEALFSAARFINLYISQVGQEAAPRECVLLSTSRRGRTEMGGWLVTGAGSTWTVKFDVRDSGGHLDVTYRGRALTLSKHGFYRCLVSALV